MACKERDTKSNDADNEKEENTGDDVEFGNDFVPGNSDKKQENTGDDDEFGNDFVPGKSDKTTVNDVLRAEANCVDNMNYIDVGDMFKRLELGIPQSEEDGKQRIKEHLFSGQRRELHSQKMQNMIQKTIKNYKDLKNLLIEQYSKVNDLIRSDTFKKEMWEIMNSRFPEFAEELETRRNKLANYSDEFEIVVIGETSAGKSTFLNVLLGEDRLPSHNLHTTSCLCRLLSSVDTRLEITKNNVSAKETIEIMDPDELNTKLERQLKLLDQDNTSLAVIDIYWPIPWLQENVILVDTPGIGERDTLTHQLAEYVPNAAGYIFIVDSERAGGIQEGGIVKLLKVIKLSADKTGSQITDQSNLLFVCNKWDLVKQEHRDDVSKNTQDKLSKYGVPLQDWQAVKFDAEMELKLQKWKANPTKSFEILAGSLEKLMIKTIDRRLGEQNQWILEFGGVLRGLLNTMVESLLMSETELSEKVKTSEKNLRDASNKLERCKEVERLVTEKGDELVQGLQRYLKDTTVISQLSDWFESSPYFTSLQSNGPLLIQERFRNVILEWAHKEPGSIKEASAQVEKRYREIEEDINSSFRSKDSLTFSFFKEESLVSTIQFKQFYVILTICFFPFLLLISCMSDFSAMIMKAVTVTALRLIDEQTLDKFISDSFRDPWQKQLETFTKDINHKIDSSQKVLQKLNQKRVRKSDVQRNIVALKKKVDKIFKNNNQS